MLNVKRGNLKEAERKPEAKLKYNSQYEPSSQRKGIIGKNFQTVTIDERNKQW